MWAAVYVCYTLMGQLGVWVPQGEGGALKQAHAVGMPGTSAGSNIVERRVKGLAEREACAQQLWVCRLLDSILYALFRDDATASHALARPQQSCICLGQLLLGLALLPGPFRLFLATGCCLSSQTVSA